MRLHQPSMSNELVRSQTRVSPSAGRAKLSHDISNHRCVALLLIGYVGKPDQLDKQHFCMCEGRSSQCLWESHGNGGSGTQVGPQIAHEGYNSQFYYIRELPLLRDCEPLT